MVGAAMAEPASFKYRAFISYSHADTAEAKWLHRALETFRINKDLVGRETEAGPIPKALRPIFRDRDEFTAAKTLVEHDPGNANLERDLSLYQNDIGDVLKAQGALAEALAIYREALAIRQDLAKAEPDNAARRDDIEYTARRIGGLAYRFLLARDFAAALDAADEAIALAPGVIWLNANRAHALMFLDRAGEARALYLKFRGMEKAQDEKSWDEVVLADFAELSAKGLTHPLMDEIEQAFGQTKATADSAAQSLPAKASVPAQAAP
jgi:tetratricopeptide (TPR) repeat protein